MPSALPACPRPVAWRFALAGTVVSLPVAAVLNRVPNSEATIGGTVIVFGALVAGSIAATRTTDPGAAGLRAGVLGGVLAVLVFGVTAVRTGGSSPVATWPMSSVVFLVFASGLTLCLAPIFGLVFGRVGGWIGASVVSRWRTGTNR